MYLSTLLLGNIFRDNEGIDAYQYNTTITWPNFNDMFHDKNMSDDWMEVNRKWTGFGFGGTLGSAVVQNRFFFVYMSGQISSRRRQLSTNWWSGNKCNDCDQNAKLRVTPMDHWNWPGKQWRAECQVCRCTRLTACFFAHSQAFF